MSSLRLSFLCRTGVDELDILLGVHSARRDMDEPTSHERPVRKGRLGMALHHDRERMVASTPSTIAEDPVAVRALALPDTFHEDARQAKWCARMLTPMARGIQGVLMTTFISSQSRTRLTFFSRVLHLGRSPHSCRHHHRFGSPAFVLTWVSRRSCVLLRRWFPGEQLH